MTLRGAAAIAAASAVVACGAAPQPAASRTPAASSTGPRVQMPSGAAYSLELALTPDDQATGLMFRESLPERTGMLFLFPENAPHHFWMKNTMIPLDMIWMDEGGTVLFISADTPPCKADPCPNYGPDVPARSVLEIAGGMAKKETIQVGSKLKFESLPR
ncbi:MAG: DUF192 domain-containing protein [Acidobacteriota bacterium]